MTYESRMACTLHMYDMMGHHLHRLPYAACNWQESIKQPGSMSATVVLERDSWWHGRLWDTLRPWRCLVALQQGERVVHAGPLTDLKWDASARRLDLTVGGGLTLLTKRLVLNRRLKDDWRDGTVLVDEKHPAGNMVLEWRRTWWFAVCCRLIMETKAWGDLPIDLPPLEEPGDKQRTYYSWDLATVADRINDIMNLEGGNEIRFDPVINEDGDLRFKFVAGKPELVTATHQWSAVAPDSRIDLTGISASGASMTNQVWACGGKDDDRTLMCRRTATPRQGTMLMQSANTAHTTVSRLSTLQQHAAGQLAAGWWPVETFELKVGEEHDVHVGDHADLRVQDDYIGDTTLRLKITDIRGDVGDDMLTISACEREEP